MIINPMNKNLFFLVANSVVNMTEKQAGLSKRLIGHRRYY